MLSFNKPGEVHPGLRSIRKFVIRNHLSSAELKQAYGIACNISSPKDLTKTPPSHKVYTLAEIIKEKVKEGMPIAEFKKMIKRWKQLDVAETNFEKLIKSLKTTEREKRILRNIVKNCLYGVLKIQDLDSGEINIVRLPHQEGTPTPKIIACGLIYYCEHLKGREVEVTFKNA